MRRHDAFADRPQTKKVRRQATDQPLRRLDAFVGRPESRLLRRHDAFAGRPQTARFAVVAASQLMSVA